MSLSVYLTREKWVSYDQGETWVTENEELYWGNITHNLGKMAREAGIYEVLWRPEELGITKASEVAEKLESGVWRLRESPEYFSRYNSPNGWGTYDGLLKFVSEYLEACKKFPEAKVEADR